MKRDLILISAFLLLALAIFVVINLQKSDGDYVCVRVGNEEIARYPLDVNGTFELNGGSNVLLIEDGSASMINASCPDKICVRMGKIKFNGQCITCLPNRLTVTVYSEDKDVDIELPL